VPKTSTQEQYYVLRTENDGRFEFKNVVPGTYKLTNRVAGKPHWRLRVTVAEGAPLSLELNPQNSTRTRDDFPEDDK
jgi:protocatechuate 3,4-dioxygenase beta subunit